MMNLCNDGGIIPAATTAGVEITVNLLFGTIGKHTRSGA